MEKNSISYISHLNAHGVVGRNFSIDAPFITDPFSLQAIQYLKNPVEILNFKSLDTISSTHKQFIYEQISRLFMLSHDSYTQYQDEYFHPQILDATNCHNPILYGQFGLFAKKPIEQYQVLGFYSGIYASSHVELEYLTTQFDILTLGRYGNACLKEGIPVICGNYNGNYMTIINDWRPFKWYEYDSASLKTCKDKYYNSNSIIIQSGDYCFIAYIACSQINQNSEIITDYGDGYWEREQEIFTT